MTYDTLKYFESEVKEILDDILETVKSKSFPDYCLLLAHAGYQYENEGTILSPYVIHSQLEINQDYTRQKFLVFYLNQYATLLKESIFMDDEYKEYDLNIQMMIYAQIWESHLFLKTLKRIADILNGKPYEWKIPFEQATRKDPSKIISVPKAKFIQEQILAPMSTGHQKMSNLLNSLYDSQLRNDFAHASYYIDFSTGKILSQDSERYKTNQSTSFLDWEDKFIYTVMLSYHLSKAIHERMGNFLRDYPDIKEVEVKWPSYKEPGKIHNLMLYPKQLERGVEFCYRK